jgi:hypothetical protein
LACFFFPFEQFDAGPVVVVVDWFLPFFLLPALVVDAVPGWCAAEWATWLAASAEVNPARPAAVARAPAAASRPMRMRDIGTSLFR